MVQLGRHFGQGPASLAEIAAEEELPRAYLEQLVMSLRDAGLVTSTRGAHGGYELARPPAEIRMSDVLRALEGPLAPMICASDDPEHAIVCDRSLALHRQRPVGPRPRRDHLDPRFHDPRRPRATARRRRRRPQGSAHHIVTDSTASQRHPRHPRPPRRARRQSRDRDPPGDRPRGRQGRGPRDHGPQRIGQDDARLRAARPSGLRRHRRRGPLEGPRHPQAEPRQAGPPRDVPRLPVPDRDPRPQRRRRSSGARSTRSSRASTRPATSTRPTR